MRPKLLGGRRVVAGGHEREPHGQKSLGRIQAGRATRVLEGRRGVARREVHHGRVEYHLIVVRSQLDSLVDRELRVAEPAGHAVHGGERRVRQTVVGIQ
jgi:hypothetical protein